MKPQINKRGYRYKQLTEKDKLRNHKLSSKRCRVEHIFGAIKQKSGQIIRAGPRTSKSQSGIKTYML
ncbi:MAG: transposase [Bacteroidetes bacterium]|nr:transposase [Bacteroidota bacterium]MBK7390110.1 transposase [Bacteroidota bacterium]